MTKLEKEKLMMSVVDSFPPGLNPSNLMSNRSFIDWFLRAGKVVYESDFWDEDTIKNIQAKRLKNILCDINNQSSFWRRYFETHEVRPDSESVLEDIKRLPILDRNFLNQEKDAYILPPLMRASFHTFYSSGTTGSRVAVLLSEREMLVSELTCLFRHDRFDEKSIINALNRKFVFLLGMVMRQYSSLGKSFTLDNFTKLSDEVTRNEIYQIMRKMGPVMLWGFPSVIVEFARHKSEDDIHLPVLAVYIHGEASTKEEKFLIRDSFNAPVVHRYAGRESGVVGTECSQYFGRGYYHIHRERLIVEIVDDAGFTVEDGVEGRIVVTVLDRKVTPIIRYATGDTGRLLRTKCSCGRKSSLLEVRGREGEVIKLPGGKIFSATLLKSILFQAMSPYMIKQYQIVQRSPYNLDIFIVPIVPFIGREADMLRSVLSGAIDHEIDITIREVREIEKTAGGKEKAFVPLNKTI